MKSDIAIIGGGHAAGLITTMLVKNKFQGTVTIVSEENYIPYQRPPLSKGYLDGTIKKNSLFIKKEEFYKKNNVSILKNTIAVEIQKEKNKILLSNNDSLSYKTLIIATGSRPIEIESNLNSDDQNYLRTIDDSKKIKTLFNTNDELVIIGSGYIGLELASIGSKQCKKISILESEDRILKRVASKEISSFFQKKHQPNGVNFILRTYVKRITYNKDTTILLLKDKTEIKVNSLIIGIGIKPNIEIAENAGLNCSDGILVDEKCMTSYENIYAVGDCTNHFRLESVQNVADQSKIIAQNIMGIDKKYSIVPWFWSDQYNLKLQIAGIPEDDHIKIIRGSINEEAFSVCHLKDNRLVAIECVNKMKDFLDAKKLIKSRKLIKTSELKTANNLKDLL